MCSGEHFRFSNFFNIMDCLEELLESSRAVTGVVHYWKLPSATSSHKGHLIWAPRCQQALFSWASTFHCSLPETGFWQPRAELPSNEARRSMHLLGPWPEQLSLCFWQLTRQFPATSSGTVTTSSLADWLHKVDQQPHVHKPLALPPGSLATWMLSPSCLCLPRTECSYSGKTKAGNLPVAHLALHAVRATLKCLPCPGREAWEASFGGGDDREEKNQAFLQDQNSWYSRSSHMDFPWAPGMQSLSSVASSHACPASPPNADTKELGFTELASSGSLASFGTVFCSLNNKITP